MVVHTIEADMAQLSFLEFDGATSYAMVWVNEKLVGGWPYGDNTLRLDMSEYLNAGENSIAMRLDNLQDSGRWYPGGGLYRNVWLVSARLSELHPCGALWHLHYHPGRVGREGNN